MRVTEKDNPLKAYPQRRVQIGDTLHIFIGDDAVGTVDRKIRFALSRGKTVKECGIEQWITLLPLRDPSKIGSACYTWDKTGNKVKAEKIMVTKFPDGSIHRASVGYGWTTEV